MFFDKTDCKRLTFMFREAIVNISLHDRAVRGFVDRYFMLVHHESHKRAHNVLVTGSSNVSSIHCV